MNSSLKGRSMPCHNPAVTDLSEGIARYVAHRVEGAEGAEESEGATPAES